MRESTSERVHARWETICYHHAKFHEIPSSSLGGDDEQRFWNAVSGTEKNKKKKKKKIVRKVQKQ
jgi:hypothetical protein